MTAQKPTLISDKVIGRLSIYRRMLNDLHARSVLQVNSRQLADLAGVTAAQVRRDMMVVGCTGSSARGYHVPALQQGLGRFLDAAEEEGMALIGIGNLGRALLSYFAGRRSKLAFRAAFDLDPSKTARVLHGCRCYALADLPRVIAEQKIKVAAITVPAAEAQGICDQLVQAGVRGILNFAPVPLRAPESIYIEQLDMSMTLEKVSYFARQAPGEEHPHGRDEPRPGNPGKAPRR